MRKHWKVVLHLALFWSVSTGRNQILPKLWQWLVMQHSASWLLISWYKFLRRLSSIFCWRLEKRNTCWLIWSMPLKRKLLPSSQPLSLVPTHYMEMFTPKPTHDALKNLTLILTLVSFKHRSGWRPSKTNSKTIKCRKTPISTFAY